MAECANGFAQDGIRIEGEGHEFLDVTDKPFPTIQSSRPVKVIIGVGANVNYKPYWRSPDLPSPTITIEDMHEKGGPGWIRTAAKTTMHDKEKSSYPTKPLYRVPLMSEIAALRPNGFNVVSTFSGAGGSCTGYRMAGFRVAYASEFIPEAQRTYKANHPDSFLDPRDIRKVTAASIFEATGLAVGEIDLFDGSPPCASFSTAGKREAGWGKVKQYSDTKQRTDDLFFEYARLVRELKPKTFVAENVSGLVKGTAKGYFLEILATLKAAGYRVGARVLDAQWLGVPQTRQRLIFVGVRNDLNFEPVYPTPLAYRYSVRDALPAVFEIEPETDISRFAIGEEWDKFRPGEQSKKYFQLSKPALNEPCGTITFGAGATSCAGVVHPTEKRRFAIAELKRICGFPDDYVLSGTYQQQWERLGRAVPPVMMAAIAAAIRDRILCKL